MKSPDNSEPLVKLRGLVDEADFHANALGVIIASVNDMNGDTREVVRTLYYAQDVVRRHHLNLADLYSEMKVEDVNKSS